MSDSCSSCLSDSDIPAILTRNYRRRAGDVRNISRLRNTPLIFARDRARSRGIHFTCDTEIGQINHFAADEIAGEDDRIKFPAARDAELSYGFVRELIMFRNRRPGDRERTVIYIHGGRALRVAIQKREGVKRRKERREGRGGEGGREREGRREK